jgi:hypothetical protein
MDKRHLSATPASRVKLGDCCSDRCKISQAIPSTIRFDKCEAPFLTWPNLQIVTQKMGQTGTNVPVFDYARGFSGLVPPSEGVTGGASGPVPGSDDGWLPVPALSSLM